MKRNVLLVIMTVILVGLLIAIIGRKELDLLGDRDKSNIVSEEDTINLYFSDNNAEYLIAEERKMKEITPVKAIQALIDGPESQELLRTLPKELEVSKVSIIEGVAHVYIYESVPLEEHGNYGSSSATGNIINSISATLILHEPFGIQSIKLEGDIDDLLACVDTDELFEVNKDQIKED